MFVVTVIIVQANANVVLLHPVVTLCCLIQLMPNSTAIPAETLQHITRAWRSAYKRPSNLLAFSLGNWPTGCLFTTCYLRMGAGSRTSIYGLIITNLLGGAQAWPILGRTAKRVLECELTKAADQCQHLHEKTAGYPAFSKGHP